MEAVYNLCVKLIEKGKTAGLAAKIDVYYANDRLTEKEYSDLMNALDK